MNLAMWFIPPFLFVANLRLPMFRFLDPEGTDGRPVQPLSRCRIHANGKAAYRTSKWPCVRLVSSGFGSYKRFPGLIGFRWQSRHLLWEARRRNCNATGPNCESIFCAEGTYCERLHRCCIPLRVFLIHVLRGYILAIDASNHTPQIASASRTATTRVNSDMSKPTNLGLPLPTSARTMPNKLAITANEIYLRSTGSYDVCCHTLA